jgi:phosphoribosylanthranilate isomerase
MKLKVCGMRDEENIKDVSSLGVDYLGFIFYAKSPRYVGQNFRMPAMPANVKKVGVFVNETTEAMKDQVKNYGWDYLQLHGNESVEQCAELKDADIGVIKVFSVDGAFDFNKTTPYKGAVDFFLFDTKGKYYGGNAKRFDWTILKNYDQEVPFFLSGGIGPDTLEGLEELRGMNLHALDVNSGVESAPAVKDIAKIKLVKQYLNKVAKNQN